MADICWKDAHGFREFRNKMNHEVQVASCLSECSYGDGGSWSLRCGGGLAFTAVEELQNANVEFENKYGDLLRSGQPLR